MIGYKPTYSEKGKPITYEIDKIYIFHGVLQRCEQGFHFCKKMEDVFEYYVATNSKLKVFKIEILGDIIIDTTTRSITNKFKVLKEVPLDDWRKFDKNNNLIYHKNSNGIKHWYKYDANNNLIYYKDSDGKKYWQEFDKNNNCIYHKTINGYKYWKKYDENNNLIYYKDTNTEWSITIE